MALLIAHLDEKPARKYSKVLNGLYFCHDGEYIRERRKREGD